MKWRHIVIALHRDLGYFFAGATVLFAISGLAVNHAGQWDPDFVVKHETIEVALPLDQAAITSESIEQALLPIGNVGQLRTFDFPTPLRVKLYLDDGSILVNLKEGTGVYESVRQRKLLYEANRLHLDPATWWLFFSDIFAASLLILAVTGLLILRGKNGFMRRGKWLTGAGMIGPIIGLIVY